MKIIFSGGTAFFLLLFVVQIVQAQVTGDCVNCHTMHNSQNGQPISFRGATNTVPQDVLLVADCIGCHSSTNSETILALGNTRVPIVYNQSAPTNPLAGGNFYWVAGGADGSSFGDNFGHNVYGIVGQDAAHDLAPGGAPGISNQSSCSICHATLGVGCKSCHLPKHHARGGAPGVADQEDGWYRFLGSAMYAFIDTDRVETTPGVTGVEEASWEQVPSSTVHNVYKGTAALYGEGDSWDPVDNSIGSFCAGCHSNFHAKMINLLGWIRHPSDVVLPVDADSEYARYTIYNPLAPVAKQTLDGSVTETVVPGSDLVTCLSCHRAHGSPNADMLRWDYEGGCRTGQPNDDCGCFVCHTTKDAG